MASKNPFQDLQDIFAQFSSGVETSKILETYRKNLDSLTQVQQLSLDCGQALVKCHAGFWQSLFDNLSSGLDDISRNGSPDAKMKTQMELLRQNYTSAQHALKEAANIVQESNQEALTIMQQRLQECAAEIQGIVPSAPRAKRAANSSKR